MRKQNCLTHLHRPIVVLRNRLWFEVTIQVSIKIILQELFQGLAIATADKIRFIHFLLLKTRSFVKGRSKKNNLREFLLHDVFVSTGSTDADKRQLSTAAVQTQLRHVMAKAVLIGHSEAELLPLIQEALGHLHYPGEWHTRTIRVISEHHLNTLLHWNGKLYVW